MGEKYENKENKDNFILKIVKGITIEPAVFIVSLSTTIENIANSQIAIDKTCKVDFQYNETVCDKLVTDFKDENEAIQEDVAQFLVYKTLIISIFPMKQASISGVAPSLLATLTLALCFSRIYSNRKYR